MRGRRIDALLFRSRNVSWSLGIPYFDFGPPNDYYELLLVKPGDNGISIERIILTPATDACFLPAKVETKTATATDSVEVLLGSKNPCAIPEKDLHRELKRKKKGLVFSGADIAIQVQCGPSTRVIRADILDRDMFDPAPNTPPSDFMDDAVAGAPRQSAARE